MLFYLDFACSMERMKRRPDTEPREPMSERQLTSGLTVNHG